jgi:16S rRNA (guanine966-N2)-methyltransferase
MAGKLRITGGTHRGRLIDVPKAADAGLLRPTPDRVRAAIFSSLGERVKNSLVLDVFAGTGIQALEAISRGATSAILIELNADSASVIRKNAALLKAPCEVVVGDAFKQVSQVSGQFDLVFVDPPYPVSLTQNFWKDMQKLLAPEAIVVFRREKLKDFVVPDGFEITREREYAGTAVFFLRSVHEAGDLSGKL